MRPKGHGCRVFPAREQTLERSAALGAPPGSRGPWCCERRPGTGRRPTGGSAREARPPTPLSPRRGRSPNVPEVSAASRRGARFRRTPSLTQPPPPGRGRTQHACAAGSPSPCGQHAGPSVEPRPRMQRAAGAAARGTPGRAVRGGASPPLTWPASGALRVQWERRPGGSAPRHRTSVPGHGRRRCRVIELSASRLQPTAVLNLPRAGGGAAAAAGEEQQHQKAGGRRAGHMASILLRSCRGRGPARLPPPRAAAPRGKRPALGRRRGAGAGAVLGGPGRASGPAPRHPQVRATPRWVDRSTRTQPGAGVTPGGALRGLARPPRPGRPVAGGGERPGRGCPRGPRVTHSRRDLSRPAAGRCVGSGVGKV